MLYYLTAVGLIAHTCFWGLGLSWLLLSWHWRRWWWVFAPGLGIALQSAVVWAGAHTGLQGTNQYAWWSELLPLGLLAGAVVRLGPAVSGRLVMGLGRRPTVFVVTIGIVAGWFLLSPMAAAGRGLSSSSLGSCDHADYAAGARVFAEFSRSDRTGMMGLTEVTQIGSVTYFFDFWLRLNHFTPSALIAHHGAIFGLEVYRLVSVFAAVLLLLNVPLVFFLARLVARVKTGPALGIASLYALSPLSAYAVHQGALGQLLAAQGIALLGVGVALLFREAGRARSLRNLGTVVFAAFWLLAGSYNFILTVCLAQAFFWLLLHSGPIADRRRVFRVVLTVAGAFGLCLIFFWPRFAGIVERFQLFADHDYGWAVPLLTGEGWLGLVGDAYLEPYAAAWRGLALGILITVGSVSAIRAWRTKKSALLGPVALVLPVVCGWTILAWASLQRANASYDAFKVLSVFYPGLLAGLGAILFAGGSVGRGRVALGLMGGLLALNAVRAEEFREKMSRPPLRVDRHLAGLARIEALPAVASVNVRISLYWARLWADAFLLRTPHYFEEPAYEGRNVTPLRGDWDLDYSLLQVLPARAGDVIDVGPNFHLVRADPAAKLTMGFGTGWNDYERFGTNRWRWTSGAGQIVVTNAGSAPVTVNARFLVEGTGPGETLRVDRAGEPWLKTGLRAPPSWSDSAPLVLPPGRTLLTLAPVNPAPRDTARDSRTLGVALHSLELRPMENP